MIGSHLRQNSDRPIAITMGDPAGIGPEIAAKAFAAGLPAPAVLIGDPDIMARTVMRLNLPLRVEEVTQVNSLAASPSILPVLATSRHGHHIPMGHADARAGQAAYDAVLRAADLAKDGMVRAMVTGPINKAALHLAGCPLPGHTEILAQRADNSPVAMMLASEELRVLLVSIHVPLSEAIRLVTPRSQARAIGFAQAACRRRGIDGP
jgi:4-hydroxythreonine-4-phosphate dehydrogenase